MQVHLAPGLDSQPLRVIDGPVGGDANEPIGHRHLVEVALLPVDNVGVGTPDPEQELPVHGQLSQPGGIVAEPFVPPVLYIRNCTGQAPPVGICKLSDHTCLK